MAVTVEEHSPFLEALIYLNQAKVVVEIGVAEAKTTAYLCQGAAKVNGFVYGYDIWGTHGEKVSSNIGQVKKNVKNIYVAKVT